MSGAQSLWERFSSPRTVGQGNLDRRPQRARRARYTSILLIVAAAMALPLGSERWWLSGVLLVIVIPATSLLESRISAPKVAQTVPIADMMVCLIVSFVWPVMWTSAILLGTFAATTGALVIARRKFFLVTTVFGVGMAISGWLHDAPDWNVLMLAALAALLPIAFFGAWFMTDAEVAATRNRLLVESATALFFEFDTRVHKLRSMTGDTEQLIGYSANDVLRLFPFEVVDDAGIATLAQIESHAAADGLFRATIRAQHRDGSWRWFLLVGSRSDSERHILVGAAFDVTDLETSKIELRARAEQDSLTGLLNREAISDLLEQQLLESPDTTAFLMLDLNGFKQINDTLGHPIGDRVLTVLARRLESLRHDGVVVARLGGDEFGFLVQSEDPIERATEVGGRIAELVEQTIRIDDMKLSVAASVGVAAATPGATASDLVRDADIAMYQAKRGRLGLVVFSDRPEGLTADHLALSAEIGPALEGDIKLWYQPIVDIASGEVVAAEGLARWHHRTRGVLLPNEFLGAINLASFGDRFDHKVLREACEFASRHGAAPDRLEVAVNMSAAGIRSKDGFAMLREFLDTVPIDAAQLTIEISESDLDEDLRALIPTLYDLRGLGVGIALDDFGTGFSSLIRLRDLPFTSIKIDQQFVRGITRGGTDAVIVRSTIELARELGLVTVAEGVEDQETLDALAEMGCDRAQGYLFSPAVEEADFARDLLGRGPAAAAGPVLG